MCTAIEAAGREAMHPDSENRLDLFKCAIREVLDFRADAMRSGIYFKDPEVKLKAYETRWRAERRLAQFLMAMDEGGLRDPGQGQKGRKASAPSGLPTLTDLGIDRHESQRWQKLGRMSDAEFETWLETELAKKSQRRSRRRKGPVDYPLHPITNDYADFTEEELTALRKSLRERGLVVPIVIWCNQTVDGKHRTKLCKEEGIPLRYRDITKQCPTEDDMRAYVRALNEHRRANTKPLTTAEKQARIEAALKADPERSDAAIAKEVGATHPTVGHIRQKLEAEGVVNFTAPSERKSQTGKKGEGQRRTPRKPKRTPPAVNDARDDVAQCDKPAPVPEPAAKPVGPEPMGSDNDAQDLAPATKTDAAPPAAPDQPAPTPDPWADQRALFRDSIRGLRELKDDFGPLIATMPSGEADEAKDVVFALSAALHAAIDRATPVEEPMSPRRDAGGRGGVHVKQSQTNQPALTEQYPSPDIIDDLPSSKITKEMPPIP
jgi:ParB-like chromosome segregation protein Spo0J